LKDESNLSPSQTSDNPPPYSKYPEGDEDRDLPRYGGGDRKDKEGNDDAWQGEYGSGEKGDGGRDGGGNDDRDRGGNDDRDRGGNDDNDGEKPQRNKVSKKTEVACHFCRGKCLVLSTIFDTMRTWPMTDVKPGLTNPPYF
jgi:hypothetical protein